MDIISNTVKILLVCSLVSITGAGCGVVAASGVTTSQPAAPQATSIAIPLPPTLPAVKPVATQEIPRNLETAVDPHDAAIVYTRSGGFAGTTTIYRIFLDGSIEVNGKPAGAISAQQVATLIEKLYSLGLADLSGEFLPFDTCCDRFTYMLTVSHGGKIFKITTIDGNENTPQAVWDMFAAVKELLKLVEP